MNWLPGAPEPQWAQWTMSAMTDDEGPRALIARLRELAEQYGRRDAEHGSEAARGRWFNGFLADLLGLYGIEAHSDQLGRGQRDEIDVYARLVDVGTFLLEGKWTTDVIDIGPVTKLKERLRVRPAGTFGALVSMSGYTEPVLRRAQDNADILLLEREHVDALVGGVLDPFELFSSLLRYTNLRGGALASLAQLLSPVKALDPPAWVPAGSDDAPAAAPDVEYAAPDVVVTPLFTVAAPWFTPFTGMAADGKNLLLTCDAGIVRFAPGTGRSRLEHALSGCHGPVARGRDGRLLAMRDHGVIALGPDGAIAAVGGPLDLDARFPPGSDGTYAFATTGPPGPAYRGSHLLTRLNGAVGRDETLPVDYVGDIRRTAILPGDRLYLVGGYHAGVVPIGTGMALPEDQWFQAAPLAEPGALLPLDEHRILSAGRDSHGVRVDLYVTDLRTREHQLLASLHAHFPVALVRGPKTGTFHLLLNVWGHHSTPRATLLQLTLPV